jgi:IclR family transcriptional regulator, KDG regulon repressor
MGGDMRPPAEENPGSAENVPLVVTLLDALGVTQGVSASELAAAVGQPRESLVPILNALCARGYVLEDTLNLYWLGPQLHYLGALASARQALIHASVAEMEEMVRESRDGIALSTLPSPISVSVSARRRSEIVLVAARGSTEYFQLRPISASRGPMHIGGTAKLILAFGPQSLIDEVISEHLQDFVPSSVRTREAVLDLMHQIRRDEFYISVGESHPDVTTVCAPVRDAEGRVVAALTILTRSLGLTAEHTDLMRRRVIAAAERISSRLGFEK